ncbi:MAG: diacylglycerol kinase family protein [Coriobacteriales bacterium]|jgi:diacylglycerol kinase
MTNPSRQEGKSRPARSQSLAHSFGCAFSGIAQGAASQRNMKIHIAVAVLAIIACTVLKCTAMEWAVVLVLIGAVIAAELFNTAIESVVDLASPDIHPLAKRAKDVAAGAVLVLAITAVVVGLIIFIGAFIRLI